MPRGASRVALVDVRERLRRWVLASRETLWRWRSAARMGRRRARGGAIRGCRRARRGARRRAGDRGGRSGRGRRGRAVLRFSSASSMRSSVMIPRAFFSGMERSLPGEPWTGETSRRSDGRLGRGGGSRGGGNRVGAGGASERGAGGGRRLGPDLVSDMPPERVDRRAVPSIARGRARSPTVNNDPARALRATRRRRASTPHPRTSRSRRKKRARASAGHRAVAQVGASADVSTASALVPPPVCDAHRRSRDRFSQTRAEHSERLSSNGSIATEVWVSTKGRWEKWPPTPLPRSLPLFHGPNDSRIPGLASSGGLNLDSKVRMSTFCPHNLHL